MKTRSVSVVLAIPMLVLLLLPLIALLSASRPDTLVQGVQHPLFWQALG